MAAEPVIFGRCTGFYMPPLDIASGHAVLFVSPWGFEELSIRKYWRVLAERLAAQGTPSLRFDMPGTGNSLDLGEAEGLSAWTDAILDAAFRLQSMSGVKRITIIAQGLGAALAASMSNAFGPLAGMALLSPVLSGRLYMRELSLWARMTEGVPDPEKELKEGRGYWISGFRMPDRICDDLRRLAVSPGMPIDVQSFFVAPRADRQNEKDFASALQAAGHRVVRAEYTGYDRLISNLNFSEEPRELSAALLDWMATLAADRPKPALALVADVPVLAGDGFSEWPVRFGTGKRLVGTICEPADGIRRGASVVMLSTAYHPSAGWGRIGAEACRALAREGIASLRFDYANAADSPPLPGAPAQILYSPAQNLDVSAGVDLLERKGHGPIIIAGRCSGGYLAFRSILLDSRLKGAVAANPYVFYWDGKQKVEDLLRFVPKPLGNYGAMLLNAQTWKRMLSGEIDVKAGLVNITRGLAKRMLHCSERVLQTFPFLSREYREVHSAFNYLQARQADISLLYADDDPGMAHLEHHFGERGRKVTAAYPGVRLELIPATDHNLSTPAAREIFVREVREMALRHPPQKAKD